MPLLPNIMYNLHNRWAILRGFVGIRFFSEKDIFCPTIRNTLYDVGQHDMRVIFEILDEEWGRLQERSERYLEEISSLPKGSLSLKDRRGRKYAYLSERKKDKVVSRYLGEAHSEIANVYREKIELRRKLEKGVREMKLDMKALEKVLHARRKK